MFTISGTLKDGDVASITWDAGRLSGPGADFAAAAAVSMERERVEVGPHEGPYTYRAYLREPLSALFMLITLFVPYRYVVTGDVPERPPIPAGAIGD